MHIIIMYYIVILWCVFVSMQKLQELFDRVSLFLKSFVLIDFPQHIFGCGTSNLAN